MGMSTGGGNNSAIMGAVALMLSAVLGLIGLNILAQPLAQSVVEATTVTQAQYLGTFLRLIPLFIAVGLLVTMFGGAGLGAAGGSGGIMVLLKIIAVIVAVIMMPILFIQLTEVLATYAVNICTAKGGSAGAVVVCDGAAGKSIAGAYESTGKTAAAVTANAAYAGKFTAIVQVVPLILLGYVLATIYFVLPSGARGGLHNRAKMAYTSLRR